MTFVQDENCLSPYRKLLVDLSFDLSRKDLETLNLAGVDFIPRGTTEKICSGLQFFDILEQDGRIGPRNLALLQDMLETIGRMDLVRKIQAFLTASVNDKTDAVPNGSLPDDHTQWQHLTDDDLVTDRAGDDHPSNDVGDGSRYTDRSIMGLKFEIRLLLSILMIITSIVHAQVLFRVVKNDGKFYRGIQPQHALDNWLGTAKLIGGEGWTSFRHLFFHPDGTLYGVVNDKFYKAPPPHSASQNWLAEATYIGTAGWNGFQFLFFDPNGNLYGVRDGKFYQRTPPAHSHDDWLGSAQLVGSDGWNVFKFLFFDHEGMLYGVENGKFHKRRPPTAAYDNWLRTSTLIGTAGWSDFQFLFFMSDGNLYGVIQDKFYKRSPPTHSLDNWLGSSSLIGSGGLSVPDGHCGS